MATPDMEVIKEIPGYKVILKAVLKNQIQQLVEQLATSTDEESVILTASVADGTLSLLGSNSGKVFLEDHEDIKSQFLGFCLKRHHKQKQERQDKERQEVFTRSMPVTPPRYGDMGGRPGYISQRSPRFSSPRHQGPLHPVAMRASGPGMRGPGVRHEPYPMLRPQRRASFDQQGRGSGPSVSPSQGAMRFPAGSKLDGQVIKIEPDGDDEHSNQSAEDGTAGVPGTDAGSVPSSSQPVSPSGRPASSSQSKGEPSDKDDDAKSESSTSTIPNEASDMKFSDTAPPCGLSLDSDLSNLISQESCSGLDSNIQLPGSAHESSLDPNVIVKRESMADSEMDLEITGVELGQSFSGSSEAQDWVQNIQNPMGGAATGSPGDMASQQGYKAGSVHILNVQTVDDNDDNEDKTRCSICSKKFDFEVQLKRHLWRHARTLRKPFKCPNCVREFAFKCEFERHMRTHTGEKPYQCQVCNKWFQRKSNLENHMMLHTNEKPLRCEYCPKRFTSRYNQRIHIATHTGDKPYKCDLCDKQFVANYALQLHKKIHAGEKPHECPTCNKKFLLLSNMKQHMGIHNTDKVSPVYQCHICSKQFKKLHYAVKHINQHTDDNTVYECESCKETFLSEMDMSAHTCMITAVDTFVKDNML